MASARVRMAHIVGDAAYLARVDQRPVAQVVDFIGLTELARRTGRFPQLVDPRSRVNGRY